MRFYSTVLLFCFLFAAGSLAAPAVAAPDPMAVAAVTSLVKAMNAGDTEGVASACTRNTTVMDEFPPYTWGGTDACSRWTAAYMKVLTSAGLKDARISTAAVKYSEVSGGRAYLVFPTRLDATFKGKPVWETGQWSFVLAKVNGDWKIVAIAWAHEHDNM